jgi:microcystin-dependent protein
MGIITGLTAARMQAIIDSSIISGAVNGLGHLILTKSGGGTVDAGGVAGPAGATGAAGATGPAGIGPTGSVIMYTADIAPTGWLICNGAAVSRSTFAALFAVLGTRYGVGNGTTTFNVPNMQQRYARQDTASLGVVGGADTHAHALDGGTPVGAAEIFLSQAAAPNVYMNRVTGVTPWNATVQGDATTEAASSLTGQSTGARLSGNSATANNDPPYLNLNFIIKT